MHTIGDKVWLNGKVVPVGEATVSLLDRGLQFGEGLFDTVRVYGGVPFRLDAHIDRLCGGASALGLPVPSQTMLRAAVSASLAACGADQARLRLVLTLGPPDGPATIALIAQPAVKPDHPATCVLADPRQSLGDVGARKLLGRIEYSVAQDKALAAAAAEALLTAPDGCILEGTRTNVFVVRDGGCVTPPIDGRILDGVTRAVVLEIARANRIAADERPMRADVFIGATEVFCTGSVCEIWPVHVVRGHFEAPAPGPVTRRLQKQFAETVQRETTLG